MSVLLLSIFLSTFAISNGNNIIETDCLSIKTEIDCNEYPNICEWDTDILQCQFKYKDSDIIGAHKIDLVFVADPNNIYIPNDLSLFLSSTVEKLYHRYHNKSIVDLRCAIIPYQNELVSCTQLLDIAFIIDLFYDFDDQNKNIDLLSNFEDAIDLLFETNTKNDRDRDQYIIPNFDNNNHQYLASNLCENLKELSLFRIYPLLIQWKSFEDEINFDTNCPFLQYQPQFIHKINKYDTNIAIPEISCIVASKIHRNSLNPARFSWINRECIPYKLAAQAFATRGEEIWYISGLVEIPTTNPTIHPTIDPTTDPTKSPTIYPTGSPTTDPTTNPSDIPTRSPTKWPTSKPTEWITPKPIYQRTNKRRDNYRRLTDSCSGGTGSYNGWVACTSMHTEETTIINGESGDNTDQSVSNGYITESLMSLFGSLDIYNIDNGDIFKTDISMNNYRGCIIGDGNDKYFFQIGGYDINTKYATNYFQIFDVDSMSWYHDRSMPNMNIPRYLHSCILDNYTFYVFGGIYHVNHINDVDSYYDTIEYFNFNPMGYTNMSIKQLLCLNEYDTNNCFIGGVGNKMDEPKWEITCSYIIKPRISAKVLKISENKLFLMGGYGYNDVMDKNGALQSIEIYDMETNKILYNKMGPHLIIGRAAFTVGIYDDDNDGYRCIHFIGGKTHFGDNFNKLPLLRSCEKMCFPLKIINNYIDNMYHLFYNNKNNKNNKKKKYHY